MKRVFKEERFFRGENRKGRQPVGAIAYVTDGRLMSLRFHIETIRVFVDKYSLFDKFCLLRVFVMEDLVATVFHSLLASELQRVCDVCSGSFELRKMHICQYCRDKPDLCHDACARECDECCSSICKWTPNLSKFYCGKCAEAIRSEILALD